MAVQKTRSSRAKIGKRRTHDSLKTFHFSIEKSSETKLHLNHNLTEDGFYGGKQVIPSKAKQQVEAEAEEA